MRRLLALSVVLVVLGASAGAKTVVPPAPKLRGAQDAIATPVVPAKPLATKAAAAAPFTLWTAAGANVSDCRRACGQTRYFCEANGGSDDCGSTWSQCTAACSSPNLTATNANGAD